MPDNVARPQFGESSPEDLEGDNWDYKESDFIEGIARGIINDHHSHLRNARIKYLIRRKASKTAGKITFGQAIKPGKRYNYLTDCDFIIEIAKTAIDNLTDEGLEALVDHELYHCIKADEKYKTTSHDFTGFFANIDRYGFWNKELRNLENQLKQMELPFADREE